MHAELGITVLRSAWLTLPCAAFRREPSDICALLQRLQYGRSSAGTVLSALQAIQTCTASPDSAQARMPFFCCSCHAVFALKHHRRSCLPQSLEALAC